MIAPVTYMLDTNMVSYILKGKSTRVRQHLEDVTGEDEVCISAITEAEIRYGLAKRPMRVEAREEIERFLKTIEIQAWDSGAAFQYGELRASLEAKGKTLANMDMLIAAHAAAVGAVLVTDDRARRRDVRDSELGRRSLSSVEPYLACMDPARPRGCIKRHGYGMEGMEMVQGGID